MEVRLTYPVPCIDEEYVVFLESNVKQAFRSYVQTFRSNVKKENDSFAISDNKTSKLIMIFKVV